MIGLFQENGPCHVNADGATTTLNPFRYATYLFHSFLTEITAHSWNNISNSEP